MQTSSNRLKQRAYEANAGPSRVSRRMLAGKRAHAVIAAAAATAVCLTISSTAPALLEGASYRPMDDYSDTSSGLGGLRDFFTDGSRQPAGVFATASFAFSSPSDAAASYDCIETPEIPTTAAAAGGSALAAPTSGIICLGAHDAIEF